MTPPPNSIAGISPEDAAEIEQAIQCLLLPPRVEVNYSDLDTQDMREAQALGIMSDV